MCRILYSLLLAMVCTSALASWPNDDRLFVRVPDGGVISGGIVTALVQGKDGLIWIGTQNGLIRYDGYTFDLQRADPDDVNSLAGDYVRSLAFAADGRLWIGTLGNGVSVFNPAENTFTNHANVVDDPTSLSNNRVDALASDPDGGMWVGTNGGLDYWSPKLNHFVHFRHGDIAGTPNDDRIRSLLVDKRGDVWVGSWSGLNRRQAGSDHFEDVADWNESASSLRGRNVLRLYMDQGGTVWFGTPEQGGGWVQPDTRQVEWLPIADTDTDGLAHPWVTGIAENGSKELWVGTYGGGINIVDLDTRRIIGHLRSDPSVATSVGSDEIGPLMVDQSGLLWVGNWSAGLQYFNTRNQAFRMIHPSSIYKDSISFADVSSVMVADDGVVWVGTAGDGIDLLDLDVGVVAAIRPEKGRPGALSGGGVTAMAQSVDGTIWVGTRQAGLFRRNPGSDVFEHFTSENGLLDNYIHRLKVSPDGALWVGTSGGLNRFDPSGDEFSTVEAESNPGTPFVEQIDDLIFDASDNLWVGGETGLFVLVNGAESLRRIAHDPDDASSLSDNDVNALLITREGELWVSTARGLDRMLSWDGTRAEFDSISARLGHPGKAIGTNMMEDGQGRIWADVNAMIDPADWSLHDFGPAGGVDLGTSWIRAYAQMPDGRMIYGGSKGLVIVDADKLQLWDYDPPLVISEISVEGERQVPAGQIVLPPETRNFSVGFAALDYSDPDSNLYQFRLDPFDRDWIDAPSSRRIATYTHIDPGQYVLRIRGSNRLGRWSSHPLSIGIQQSPAWYQSAAFRITMAAAVLLVLYLVYRLRVRQLVAARRVLDSMVKERTEDLQRAMVKLEEASLTDPLTGLRNRRYLSSHIDPDLQIALRAHREASAPDAGDLVFFLFDIDHFKSVNDRYGHSAGDAILQQFAALLKDAFRASDAIVRWGGEEFLVVSRFVNRNGAAEMAERLRHGIESKAFEIGDGRVLNKSVSIGFAAFPFIPGNPSLVGWEQVVDIADVALLAAKRTERNAWIGISAYGSPDKEDVDELFRMPGKSIEGNFRIETSIADGRSIRWEATQHQAF